jgi:hypothetical protein
MSNFVSEALALALASSISFLYFESLITDVRLPSTFLQIPH